MRDALRSPSFFARAEMSDSEDSNFSEEEDSERSSDGEEPEVCAWDAGGGIARGDRTRTGRPLWELRGEQSELWPLGAPRYRERERKVGRQRGRYWRLETVQIQ